VHINPQSNHNIINNVISSNT